MSDLTDADLDRMDRTLARAHEEIANLCSGARRWTMSVPVREATDSDTLLSAALTFGERAVAEVRRLRAVVAAHPTGPDQDQPAAWELGWRNMHTGEVMWAKATRSRAEALEMEAIQNGVVRPLYLRAREAQATAPAADEDAHA